MSVPGNRKQELLLTAVCAVLFPLHLFAVDPDPKNAFNELSISGINELRLAHGYDISSTALDRPWNYLLNSSDISVELYAFYVKMRFDVEEPSMGYNPPEQVYREYISRRTFGFALSPVTIEAGHVSAQFGRGLTLSLKEDREVEKYSILDGVYGNLLLPCLTLKAIAGRPIEKSNTPVAILVQQGAEEPDTMLVQNEANLRLRDNVLGIYTEAFVPDGVPVFPFLSSASVSGGLVRFSSGVGPLSLAYHDTAALTRPFWYQSGQELLLPSASMNLAAGDYGLSIDQAWMTGRVSRYVNSMDPARGAFDSAYAVPYSASTYVCSQAQIFGVSLLAEYKNYDYGMSHVSTEEIASYVIPPSVRFQHTWHLLSKHLLSNLMDDAIGYNILLSYSPAESSLLTACVNYGGRHEGQSWLKTSPGSTYWEAYGEWSQKAGDFLDFKAGLDYGKLDPEQPKETFRTLALNLNAGPFKQRHGFGVTLEGQLNDKPFFAEKDVSALKDLIARVLPSDSLSPVVDTITGIIVPKDTLQYDYLVPDADRSRYVQFAVNMLATLSYSFSPYFTVALTVEHEALLEERDLVHAQTEISSLARDYASIGLTLRPLPNHTITAEYGSMSGGKKCALGTCVDIPPFRGFKLTVTSAF